MTDASIPRTFHVARGAALLAIMLLAWAPSPAAAQDYCAQHVTTLLNTSSSCVNEPWRERASDVETFNWKGHAYTVLNRGNELTIYQIDDPSAPIHIDTSEFDFDTRGDSDYDLLDFDVCDECRYMVFSHKVQRTVVVDLGGGAVPNFGLYGTHEAGESVAGGYMFLKGGQQYLIAANLPGGCYDSGLYLVNGVNQLEELECLDIGGSPVTIKGLNTITTSTGVLYLYAGAINGQVHVFRADGSGSLLTLVYQTSPPGMFGRRYELAIDPNTKRAASAEFYSSEVRIWDLANPASPALDFTIPVQASTVSLRSPAANAPSTLYTSIVGWPGSTRTFIVDDSGYLPVVEESYWTDTSLPHNIDVPCVFDSGGALSPDGSVLYLSRYAVHQVFDLAECLTPTPAVADLGVTPSPVFPGQTIQVRDTSSGRIDEWALWITRNSTIVAGTDVLNNTNPRTLSYTIPPSLPLADTYKAHVEVDSSELIPDDPYHEETIVIDRTPTADFTISPSAVIVGDTVTLTASAEGVVAAGSDYAWVIDGPATAPVSKSGQTVTHTIPANEGGTWVFRLTVHYGHGASGITNPGGGIRYGDLDSDTKYEYEITRSLNVTSVAADFFWTPATPLHTQQITLNGSTSKPTSGLTYQWQVVKQGGGGGYTGCPNSVQCLIPADTLEPATVYNVTLTAINGPDSSTITKAMSVGDGNVNPTISFSPSNPEIGDTVLFLINGVPADIDSASWNMGGAGCDGADSTPTCIPSLWNECKSQGYAYSSGGNKTVSLTVEVGSNTFIAPSVQVPVQSTGSCEPTTPPPGTCEYTLGRTSIEFGPAGGTESFMVTTTSNCSWAANTTTPWITILQPAGQVSGTGTVTFRVAANSGPYRTGSIVAGGKGVVINQQAPYVPANFTMSNPFPEIGQVVTFAVDPILRVASWDFGEADCRGNDPEIDCSTLPTGACNTFQWSYPSAGPKSVTMVLSDDRTQTKTPTVKSTGECCLKDGVPDAAFEMSASEVYGGETVYFADISDEVATKALGFSWVPVNPEIGQAATFTLEGVSGSIEKVTWDFGETGCDGLTAIQECVPSLWENCSVMSFTFASSGTKSVSVEVETATGTQSAGPVSVEVANSGTCEGGGGGCSYSLSSSSVSFPVEGGSGSFDVTTSAECAWNATTTATWIDITNASGTGPGTVTYEVPANVDAIARSTLIRVEGRTHRVTQDAARGDTSPTAWMWDITRVEDEEGQTVDEDVYSSSDQHTSFKFTLPGLYRVRLTASNCYGDDFEVDFVRVLDSPVENFVVGAAVSLAGANDTQWESDFRFFSPCGENLDVRIEYLPENTNNAGAQLVFREFQLLPDETKVFGHITDAIPGLVDDVISGSVRILSQSDSGCKVLSVSRTFNDTPGGSLGLFVPALPIKRVGLEHLDLTGLIHDQAYRTNLRLVNYSDEDVWVPLTAYNQNGDQVGQRRSANVKGQSTKQINEVAEWLGIGEDLAPFSVRADIAGLDVQAFATVVDNLTGDSVLYLSSFQDEPKIWLVGVASLSGVNQSQWRTDLWLYNPTDDWLPGELEFVVGDDPSESYGFEWPILDTFRVKQYLDIVSDELGLTETRGYIVLTGDGGPAPQVAARTYNLDPLGGTYGLNLRSFASADLLQPGETGYIAGISNSADQSVGFRTNVGVLNTDRNGWTTVRITMYNLDGSQAGEPYETTIAPGKLRQFDIFSRLDLGDVDMTGSLAIEAVSGGAVAAYATEIDNRTQDSIFIPAQRMFMGLAR